MISLEARDVRFHYDGIDVLKGVTLALREGEFVGLVGPNGSGKSTLLRTLCNVLHPAAGVVLLDGNPIAQSDPTAVARRISVLPQESVYGFDFTCLDIVLMGRYPHGREGEECGLDVARTMMERTDTWQLRDRGIMEISGGERQRVGLARAFTQKPHILLLDEPTSHLDINYQREIMTVAGRMATEERCAVLAVFHDLNLASIFSRSLVMMNEGIVVTSGPPRDVLTSEHLRAVYGVEVVILNHPIHNVPLVFVR